MRKYLRRLFIALFLGSILPICAQETLTIFQCYGLARENYPKIHQYGLINQTEQYQLSNIGKTWLPQLAINAQASYQSDVTELPFNGKQISSLLPGTDIPVLSKDQYRIVAQIDQTLWDGGNSQSSKASAKAKAETERKSLESELYTLNARINHLYFGCLLQKELIQQNALLQENLQTNIKRLHAMMAQGVANQSDLESIQVELLKAKQQETTLRASMQAYRQMLGIMINHPVSENTVLTLPELPQQSPSSAINRPEMHALQAQEEWLHTCQRRLTAGLMPRLSAFVQGGYGRPALNMLSNDFEGFYVAGIRLSWNLGKLYTLKNDRREITAQQSQLQLQKETFLFNTRLQLLEQDTEIQKMQELMQTDQQIIQLRNNIKKAAEVKLENGVISTSDLIREINAEDQARQAAAVHRMEHLMQLYQRLHITN